MVIGDLLLVFKTADTYFPTGDRHELIASPDIVNSVVCLDIVSPDNPAGKAAKGRVRQLDVPRHVGIEFFRQPFTRENRMLQPSMQIDRKNIVTRYGASQRLTFADA